MDVTSELITPVPFAWSQSVHTPAGGPTALLLTSEHVVVGSGDRLLAFRLSDGAPEHKLPFSNALVVGLGQTNDGHLVATTQTAEGLAASGAIWQLDPHLGRAQVLAKGFHHVSAPCVNDGRVWVSVDGQALLGITPATGDVETWPAPADMRFAPAAPAASLTDVVVPCRGPYLVCFRQGIGLRWITRWPAVSADSWLAHTPVIDGDIVYAVSQRGEVVQVQLRDGAPGWLQPIGPSGQRLSPLALGAGRLYVGAQDGLYVLDMHDGAVVWHRQTARRISARPWVGERIVAFAGHDHRIAALRTRDGQECWHAEWTRRLDLPPGASLDGTWMAGIDHAGQLGLVAIPPEADRAEASGRWDVAARIREADGEWEAAAEDFERAGAWARAAELWERAGAWVRQAAALEHSTRAVVGDTARARIWEQVERLYLRHGNRQAAGTCRREVARCLRAPLLSLEISAQDLELGKWSPLQVRLRNEGFGAARSIVLHHDQRAQFAGGMAESREWFTLAAGGERQETLDIRPLAFGDHVPLRVQVTYQDSAGTPFQGTFDYRLPVQRSADGGVHITAGGDVIIGGDVVGHDQVQGACRGARPEPPD